MVRLKNCCIAIFFNALLLNNDRSDRRSYTGLKINRAFPPASQAGGTSRLRYARCYRTGLRPLPAPNALYAL